MNRLAAALVCVWIWSAASQLLAQATESRPEANALVRDAVLKLRHLELSAEQLTQINAVAARLGPQIRKAELESLETDDQRQKREVAIAKVMKEGLRGAPAFKLLADASERTPQQRQAFQRASQLRLEFDNAVNEMLTDAQRQQVENSDQGTARPSGFVIVQLSRKLPLPPAAAKTLEEAAAALNLKGLQDAINKWGLKKSERAVKPELLDRLDDGRSPAAAEEIRILRTFWLIDIRELKTDDVSSALESLNDLKEVEEAYAPPQPDEPAACHSVNPSDDPYYPSQGYLASALDGIDAAAAWALPGGQGAGAGLVDLERGWNIDHEDLTAILHEPIYGQRLIGNDHGTSVIGEIAALDNSVGVVGAAPCVDYVALTSRYQAAGGVSEPHIANATAAALYLMAPGDVLLVQYQTGLQAPAETETLNYRAIRLANVMGMIVIEPTGNGSLDLDALVVRGKKILNRTHPDFRDSGAILVGASDPMNGHNRSSKSCYGSRVDCFGWGNHVTTTDGRTSIHGYRSNFNGTSSAAPIIAGAALLVQGLYQAQHHSVLSPGQMRTVLSDRATGTPQGAAVAGNIGVLPNLKLIIAARGLGPGGSSVTCITRRSLRRSFRQRRHCENANLERCR